MKHRLHAKHEGPPVGPLVALLLLAAGLVAAIVKSATTTVYHRGVGPRDVAGSSSIAFVLSRRGAAHVLAVHALLQAVLARHGGKFIWRYRSPRR